MDPEILKALQQKTKLILSNVYNLPAMSGAMMEVAKLLDDPNTNSQTLSSIISKDQGIATKILSISNSPLYGLRRKVSTIDFAILVIGFTEIKNIILALSLMESFKNKTDKNLNQKEFWLHSFITANAAKRIAAELKYDNPGKAFIVGLLHDLGIPVIHKYFHTNFIEIAEKNRNENVPFIQAEVEHLGYSHAEIGNFLCNKWNLPETICDSIQYHHSPHLADSDKTLTAIVHLADFMTQKFNIGSFYWDEGVELDTHTLDILKFESMEKLEIFMDGYKALFEEEANSKLF